jgi:hypothetical protein
LKDNREKAPDDLTTAEIAEAYEAIGLLKPHAIILLHAVQSVIKDHSHQ